MTGINDTRKFRRVLRLPRCSRFLQEIQLHGMLVLPGDRVQNPRCTTVGKFQALMILSHILPLVVPSLATQALHFTLPTSTRLTRTVKLEIE